jgi:hypothetical protein
MIRPLRRRHRRLVLGVAVIVPPLFVAALASRDLPRPMDRVPAALLPDVGAPGAWAIEAPDLWPGLGIDIRIGRDPAGDTPVLELTTAEALTAPDVLLYWAPGTVAADGALPPDARLVGHMAGLVVERFRLPEPAAAGGGTLVLYSLARQELVAAAPLPALEP